MDILISGGSGFIGRAFSQWLLNHQIHDTDLKINITWLSRDVDQAHPDNIRLISYDDLQITQSTFDVILNLAGAGIADKRWTDSRKAELYDSRLGPTQSLLDYIARIPIKPKLLVSGSAIGWYGSQGDKPLNEQSEPVPNGIKTSNVKSDFAHKLCERWEKEALGAQAFGVDVIILRTGIVIHPDGGMLGRLITPFKLGTGGQLGDGEQIMSWISREDWIRAAWFIISNHLQHSFADKSSDNSPHQMIYNLTAPDPVTNAEFTKALGSWLNRPTLMTMPAWTVKALFGEMSSLLLDGQKVLPQALLDRGFEFKHTTLKQALEDQSI